MTRHKPALSIPLAGILILTLQVTPGAAQPTGDAQDYYARKAAERAACKGDLACLDQVKMEQAARARAATQKIFGYDSPGPILEETSAHDTGSQFSGMTREQLQTLLGEAQFLQHLRAVEDRIGALERCGQHFKEAKETAKEQKDHYIEHKEKPTDADRQEALRLKEKRRQAAEEYKECYAHHLQGGPGTSAPAAVVRSYEQIRKKGLVTYDTFKKSYQSYSDQFDGVGDLDEHIKRIIRRFGDIDALEEIPEFEVAEDDPPEEEPPTRWCSCEGDDWNEFGAWCIPIGDSKPRYKPNFFPWTEDCRVEAYKPAGS